MSLTSLTSLTYRVRRWLHRTATPAAHAEELNDELRFHLEMEVEQYVRSGLSPDAARRRALAELGAHGEWADRAPGRVVVLGGTSRDTAPRAALLESVARDVRLASRALRRAPAFSLVAILTIALGVGVTTAVYSTIDGVLLRPLPYPDPGRLVRLYEHSRENDRMSFAGANAVDVQRAARTLARVAYANAYDETVLGADEPLRVRVSNVSREFFDVFGVPAALGRLVSPGEGAAGGPQVAVVSDRFWRTALGATPRFADRTLRVGDASYPIVGVMPATFNFPSRADVWVTRADTRPSRTAHNWMLVGRLAPGRTVAQAQAEVDALLGRLKAQYGKETDAEGAIVADLHTELARTARPTLLILLGAVALVLLVACVNLASANLARGETRQREYAVRAALGAGRARIVREVLVESLVLAAAGGALGAALAWALTLAFVKFGGATLPRFAQVGVNVDVLLFAAATSIATGLVVGAAPAWRIARDLRGAITSGGRAAIDGARLRSRGLLIGTEVALAVALLAGAGLLVKSLRTLLAEDAGFRTDGVLAAQLSLPSDPYADTTRAIAFYDRLLPAVRAIPGVAAAGVVSALPISGNGGNSSFAVDGGTEFVGYTDYRVVDTAYFRTLGIRLVRGRSFTADDRSGTEHATVINEAMAAKYWAGGNPLGHRIRFPGMDSHADLWLTIVGVVSDVRDAGLDQAPEPAAFVHYLQRPERLGGDGALVVRTAVPMPSLGAAIRERVRALDTNVPVRLATLASVVDDSVAARRFTTGVLSMFAALALLLAAIGIHGVLAYLVAQRRREIGVRMALGAARSTVRGMVLRDAMRAVVPGIVVGVVGALALSRVLRGLLYGVAATDPTVFATVALLLAAVALGAAWIPARRATRVDPLTAIRSD